MKNQYLIFLFLLVAGSAKTQSVEHNLPTLYESALDAIVPMPDSTYLTTLYESQKILSVCKFSKKGKLLWRKTITADRYSSEPICLVDTYFDVPTQQIYLLFWVFNCDLTFTIGYKIDTNGEKVMPLDIDDTTIPYTIRQTLKKRTYIPMLAQGQKDTFLLPQYLDGTTEMNLVHALTNKKISTLTTIQGDYSQDIATLASDKIILYNKTENKVQVFDNQWNSIGMYSFLGTQQSYKKGRIFRQHRDKVWIFCKDKDAKSNPTLYEMSWDTIASKLLVIPHVLSTGGGVLNYEDVLMEEKTTWTVGASLNFEKGEHQKAFLKTLPTQTLMASFQANDVSVSDVTVGNASAIQYPSSNGGPPTFNTTFKDIKVSIKNENMPLLDSVLLNILLPQMFYFCPNKGSYSYSFKKINLKKGESTMVSLGDIKLFDYIYPASGKVDFCVWTTLPNAAIDSVVSNNQSCTTIPVALTVATEETAEEAIQFYPNPVRNFLYFKTSFDMPSNTKLLIYNNLGQRINIFDLGNATTNQTFDVSTLNEGLYWYQLQNEQAKVLKKGTFLKIE